MAGEADSRITLSLAGIELKDCGKPLNNAGYGVTSLDLHLKNVTLAAEWNTGGRKRESTCDCPSRRLQTSMEWYVWVRARGGVTVQSDGSDILEVLAWEPAPRETAVCSQCIESGDELNLDLNSVPPNTKT